MSYWSKEKTIKFLALGLVNYCVSAGEAYTKALEIAQEINEKVIKTSNIIIFLGIMPQFDENYDLIDMIPLILGRPSDG